MEMHLWVLIGIAVVTMINSWLQFWVKERLFNDSTRVNDPILNLFKSKVGIAAIALTGVVSAVSVVFLIMQVVSPEPLTRMAVFSISALTVATILNLVLIQALFTLRRMAAFMESIANVSEQARNDAITYATALG